MADVCTGHVRNLTITAEALGSEGFKRAYQTKYAFYAGSMANGISSDSMVIALGRAGYMGSFGSGGLSAKDVEQAVFRIKAALPAGPYLVNLLHTQNDPEHEEKLVAVFLRNAVRAIEASAFIDISPALIRYRAAGLHRDSGGGIRADNRIIAKVSREEVAEKFMSPPDPKVVSALLGKGLISAEQAECSLSVPVADDITAEADSGGHTDNRPLVSLLPMMIAFRDEIQRRFSYRQKIRVGAAGGIGTPPSAAGAFQMGADYIVTGSVNQSCIEAGTSDYVKQTLARVDMADAVMAPSADMFESGAKVQVIKKGTMYPMNAQKLYDLYTKYGSLDEIPEKDKQSLKTRIFRQDLDYIWGLVKEYFSAIDKSQIHRAEANAKHKMALIFRWYLGNSSRWAITDEKDRRMDMQIWCGQSMGAFNKWVKGTDLESPGNRTAAAVSDMIMRGAAAAMQENYSKLAGYFTQKEGLHDD